MIGPTSGKNWLTFSGASVPDTDSGLLFHFPHHCGIGDFRRFISISHTVTDLIFTKLGEMTDADKDLPLWLYRLSHGMRQDWSGRYRPGFSTRAGTLI